MARTKKAEPEVFIDNLHPVNDGFTHSYNGRWSEQGVIAHATLDIVDRDHWKLGQYLPNAYELVSLSPATESGRPLGPVQEELARILLRKLRERMLDLMKVAGWRSVASTVNDQPIYQYRPAARDENARMPTLDPSHRPEAETASDLEPAGPAQHEYQDQARQTKTYAVYGNKEARKRGKEPAYSRTVTAKLIRFRCAICRQEVQEWHFPGQDPSICAKPACKREAVRRRVQKWREKKKAKTAE